MWFIETPWPPIMICGALAALLAIAWSRNARQLYFVGILGLIGASIAIYVVEGLIVTEIEEAEQTLLNLAKAVEDEDVDAVMGFISEDNTVLGNSVRAGMKRMQVDGSLSITDVSSREEDALILTHFRANGMVRAKRPAEWEQHVPTRWELSWKKDSQGDWKVESIRRIHPTTGETMGLLEAQ